ncbi:MAG: 50S ribosomal protein L3 [Nanoarchaeota archaeon]|nr:50S ribosomal protein L3 [Nanoarchaeota archaeon]
MPKIHNPRRGSLQFWPRKRARRQYARVKSWPEVAEAKLLGFAGYKAGMTHVMLDDDNPGSLTKGETISYPVTVIECPPLKSYSIRFYQKTHNGSKLVSEIFSKNLDKNLKRKIKVSSKENKEPEDFDSLRLVVYTQPSLVGFKKTPELFELGVGGKDVKEKLAYAKELLNKDVKISDVFKEGQLIDTHSVTKAKGFQGTVKKFGVTIRQHKSEKTKRGVGTLGAWTPKKTDWRVAQAGKMGYHQRTEYNKLSLKIGSDPKEINPDGGFLNYGLVKCDYVIVKGSVAGTRKRLIILTEPSRAPEKPNQYSIVSISTGSKQ